MLSLAGLAGAASLALLRLSQTQAQITNPQPTLPADELQAVTLIFGSKDSTPSKWDGSVTLSKGSVEKLSGYHFTKECKISGATEWQCSTHPWPSFNPGMHPNEKGQPQSTPLETVGITIAFRAPGDAVFTVKLPKGEFSFRPLDVPETEGIFPLGASVEIYRTPPVEQVTDAEYEDDYPALAADADTLWLAW